MGPIAGPALRSRWIMRSPTKMPPVSGKSGERNFDKSCRTMSIPENTPLELRLHALRQLGRPGSE